MEFRSPDSSGPRSGSVSGEGAVLGGEGAATGVGPTPGGGMGAAAGAGTEGSGEAAGVGADGGGVSVTTVPGAGTVPCRVACITAVVPIPAIATAAATH